MKESKLSHDCLGDPTAGEWDLARWQRIRDLRVAHDLAVYLEGRRKGHPLTAGLEKEKIVGYHEDRITPELVKQTARLVECQARSEMDGKLGVLRWEAFQEHLERRILAPARRRIARGAENLSTKVVLIFLDLANFGEVNNSLGHQTGDEVLRLLGKAINTVTRDADIKGRYGGDELAIALGAAEITGEAASQEIIPRIALQFWQVVDQEGGKLKEGGSLAGRLRRLGLGFRAAVIEWKGPQETAATLVERGIGALDKVKERGKGENCNNAIYLASKEELIAFGPT